MPISTFAVAVSLLADAPSNDFPAIGNVPTAVPAKVPMRAWDVIRHSASLFRDDYPGDAQPIHFDGDRWRDYVPIRVADTVCIGERLPAGVAAVLINQNHPYPDLHLPIDAREKEMFDAIDGTRSIGTIAHSHTVRSFFRRLWIYDQVAFDASQ